MNTAIRWHGRHTHCSTARHRRHDTSPSVDRTLLGVWAHPDDEAYMSAGLMLEHIARGDRVVVITATLGEHGTADPARWPPSRLATRRLVELRNCLGRLGVREHHLLGFEDGTCADEDGTEIIARYMAEIQPDTVVTFGPDGMTGHPDHRAVSRWTTDAWAATVPDSALWYSAVTDEFHSRWGHVNDQVGLWEYHSEPPSTPAEAICHTVTLSGDHLAAKMQALRAHRSQTEPLIRAVGAQVYREWWSIEAFRSARDVTRPTAGGSTVGALTR